MSFASTVQLHGDKVGTNSIRELIWCRNCVPSVLNETFLAVVVHSWSLSHCCNVLFTTRKGLTLATLLKIFLFYLPCTF